MDSRATVSQILARGLVKVQPRLGASIDGMLDRRVLGCSVAAPVTMMTHN